MDGPAARTRGAAHLGRPGRADRPVRLHQGDPARADFRHFLDATADVAYDAQLVEKDTKKVFANQAQEGKPAEWKMAFRAGKPATEAARAFAQKWLTDLQSQGVK